MDVSSDSDQHDLAVCERFDSTVDTEPSSVGQPYATRVIEQRFTVAFCYPVVFTSGLFDPENHLLVDTLCAREPHRRHRCITFVDAGVASAMPGLIASIVTYCAAHARHVELVAAPLVMPGGEDIKRDPQPIEAMTRALIDHRIDRHSYVLAIGGGALLDAVGFVAGTVHRGVRLIRIPTTVLGQNDSGVGVKNGVNRHGQKNLIGVFAPPFAVLNDRDFLETLPPRDRIGGIAEAVKVAAIRDAAFFEWLERHAKELAAFEAEATATMIERCATLHLDQIGKGGDPFETGSARPLDFGHWAAHRLELATDHAVRHGEAVAIGIALDTRYSVLAGLLPAGEDERVLRLIEQIGFAIWHPALGERTPSGTLAVLRGIQEFREHLGGDLSITLLAGIGQGIEVDTIDESWMGEAIAWLADRAGA